MTVPPASVRLFITVNVFASKSTSHHRRPAISPRRNPEKGAPDALPGRSQSDRPIRWRQPAALPAHRSVGFSADGKEVQRVVGELRPIGLGRENPAQKGPYRTNRVLCVDCDIPRWRSKRQQPGPDGSSTTKTSSTSAGIGGVSAAPSEWRFDTCQLDTRQVWAGAAGVVWVRAPTMAALGMNTTKMTRGARPSGENRVEG